MLRRTGKPYGLAINSNELVTENFEGFRAIDSYFTTYYSLTAGRKVLLATRTAPHLSKSQTESYFNSQSETAFLLPMILNLSFQVVILLPRMKGNCLSHCKHLLLVLKSI